MARRRLALGAMVAALSTTSTTAHALDKRACVAESDIGQQERDKGHLREARKHLVACADASCPAAVRSACAEWLEGVERAMPTVVLAASTAPTACTTARDLVDVRVTMDGQPLASRLDGRPIEVDPGPHAFHFEGDGASADESLVVRQGDKARAVHVTLGTTAACTQVTPVVVEKERPIGSMIRPGPPASAFVFGGIGLAALGVFGGFALAGHLEYQNLSSTCGHTCTPAQADSVNVKFWVADAALGVGVVAVVVSTVLFLLPRHAVPRTTALLTF